MDPINVIKNKCAQYWNEPEIGDAEIHSILEFIYDEANKALKEITTLRARLDAARELLAQSLPSVIAMQNGAGNVHDAQLFEAVADDIRTWLAGDGEES